MPLDMTPNSISSRGISWYGGTQLRSCLVPVVDDAGLHQIGDPIANRSGMDAKTLLAAERAGHRLGYRAEAKLDRRAVGNEAGDVVGDGAVDPPRRPRRQLDRRGGGWGPALGWR